MLEFKLVDTPEEETIYGASSMREQTKAFARAMAGETEETRPAERSDEPWMGKPSAPYTLPFPRFDISALLPLERDSMAGILARVCAKHGQNMEEVKSERRFGRLIPPRQEFCWRAYMRGYSFSAIGRFLNYRNHATIMHHYQQWQARLDRGEVR